MKDNKNKICAALKAAIGAIAMYLSAFLGAAGVYAEGITESAETASSSGLGTFMNGAYIVGIVISIVAVVAFIIVYLIYIKGGRRKK